MALARVGQTVQLAPHASGLVFDEQVVGFVAGHAWKPVLQASPQTGVAPAEGAAQVGLPLGGSVHAVHDMPHALTLVLLFATHELPQAWYPVSHMTPQTPAELQVGEPFAGSGHTVQLFPHEVTAVLPLTTQVAFAPVPHSW